jgi:hypothetical protein
LRIFFFLFVMNTIESFVAKFKELCRIALFEEPESIAAAVGNEEFGFGHLSRKLPENTMIAWEKLVYESFAYHKKLCGGRAHHSMGGDDGNPPFLGCGEGNCQLKGSDIDRLLLARQEAVLLMDIIEEYQTSGDLILDEYEFTPTGVKTFLRR